MPSGIIPNEGLGDTLEYILKRSIGGVLPWQLMFWVNDIVPDADTELGDLEEATWSGYSRVDLTRPDWTTPTVHDGCAHSTWKTEAQVWYVTGGPEETIFGFAFVDVTLGVIRFIQRLDPEDIQPVSIGGKVTLLPTYTLTSAECAP